jgi:hypothetical protein
MTNRCLHHRLAAPSPRWRARKGVLLNLSKTGVGVAAAVASSPDRIQPPALLPLDPAGVARRRTLEEHRTDSCWPGRTFE